MEYKTPPVTSNRDFTELMLTRDQPVNADGQRSFIVVSIPVIDVPPTKGHVRGKYLSVELVEEIVNAEGKPVIKWSMATASSAGGSIPQMTTDLSVRTGLFLRSPTRKPRSQSPFYPDAESDRA